MSEVSKDDLIGVRGTADPLLYASCGLAWLNLGDLVHDSADPASLRSLDNPTPKVNEFHVLTDTSIELESGKYKADKQRLESALWMASWLKYPKNGDSTIYSERRYAMRVIDNLVVEIAGKTAKKSQTSTELLIGQRSVLMTQLVESPDSTLISQTYDIPAHVSERFRSLVVVSKVLDAVKPVLDEKRVAKQNFRDNARALQDIDPTKNLEYDAQGNATYKGKSLVTIVDTIRRQADTSNDRKLTQIWGGRPLLSDQFRHAKQITSLLMALSSSKVA